MIHQVSEHAHVREQWDNVRSRVKERWPEIDAGDLKLVDGDARRLIALVHQRTGADIHEIEDAIDEMVTAEGIMTRFTRSTSQWASQADERMGAPLAKSYQYLQEEVERAPMRSVLIAAGSGLAVGLCFAACFFRPPAPKRREYRDYLPW